jgi:ankyrin repeat protein
LGTRVFHKAEFYIRRGNRKRLRRLLNKRPQLLRSDDSLVLFNAIWHRPSLVTWLLDRGISPDCRLGAGSNTPLMQAAAEGDTSLVNLLLAHGADTEAVNECNERALGFACAWRQFDAARQLLEHGADPNTPEDADATYLDWATASEHDELVELLRAFGALRCGEMSEVDGKSWIGPQTGRHGLGGGWGCAIS